jgi:hypothetical protein
MKNEKRMSKSGIVRHDTRAFFISTFHGAQEHLDLEKKSLGKRKKKEQKTKRKIGKWTCAKKESQENIPRSLVRGKHPKMRWKCEKLWATQKPHQKNHKTTKPENPKIRVLWLKYTNCGAFVGEFFRASSVFSCVFLIIRITFYAVSDFSGHFEMGDPQVVFLLC